MSIRHMADVWADPYFGQGDKVKLLVALAIADHANSDTGLAWPAIEKLAKKSRTSVRGAQEAIREMEKDGKLEIQAGKGPSGTNLYRITPRTECTPSEDLQVTPPHTAHPANPAPRKRAAEKAADFPAEKAAPVCTQTIRNHQQPSGIVEEPSVPPRTAPAPKDRAIRGKPMEIPHESEVMLFASEIGMSETDGKRFFLHYSAQGWRAGGSKLHDWRAKMRGWKLNNDTGNAPGRNGAKDNRPASVRAVDEGRHYPGPTKIRITTVGGEGAEE